MNAVLLTVALLLGQPQAPRPPQAPPVEAFPGYNEAAARAVAQQKLLVFFYGTGYPRQIAGCVVGRQDYGELAGFDAGIIVAVPGSGWLEWRSTLPATATDADIRAAIAPRQVQAVPAPFAAPDVDLPAAVAAIVDGLERYQPAKNTQSVANGNQISRVSRKALEAHWQVPAGMVGLTGWRSDLYRNPNARPRTWRANILLWNGGYATWVMPGSPVVRNPDGTPQKSYQPEQAYFREYPDGARFVDVRSTSKGVFEAFVREKVGGTWYSSIDYEDRTARPVGYTGLTQSCGSCHSKAGTGGYAVGWVPGGDGVLSDPLDGVE